MIILVFDTETTGLPLTKTVSKEMLSLWPHIVQLSYIMYNMNTHEIIKQFDSILQVPDDIIMTDEVVQIHHITNEMTHSSTVTFASVVRSFYEDLKLAEIIVAHNFNFDCNMLKVELMRTVDMEDEEGNTKKRRSNRLMGLPAGTMTLTAICEAVKTRLTKMPSFCTMTNSVQLCNIVSKNVKTGKDFVKFPKLNELHFKLFGTIPANLHNSWNDTLVCLRCYGELALDRDILEHNIVLKKLFKKLLAL